MATQKPADPDVPADPGAAVASGQAESAGSPDDPQDVRAKFREALARKRGEGADQAEHPPPFAGSRIHGEHGKAGGGRTFRRKSGG
ncbi:MAG: DUF5302 domain-containing protein [Frankiaceae bacterium]|jgi:hypothetical protein|nr:DUF5302 domain-containing protein [Frankiaceae bacterium]